MLSRLVAVCVCVCVCAFLSPVFVIDSNTGTAVGSHHSSALGQSYLSCSSRGFSLFSGFSNSRWNI